MKSWIKDMNSTRWAHGIFSGELTIADDLPESYYLVGWTKAPITCYLLIYVRVNIGFWRPEVKLAYGFIKG